MSDMVHVAALGLCEHCGVMLNVSNMPGDAMDAVWKCPNPKCGKEITGASFGFDKKNVKIKWVGPGGVWVNTQPKRDFKLGNMLVVLRIPCQL